MRARRIIPGAVVLLIAAAVLVGVLARPKQQASASVEAVVGHPAPPFSLLNTANMRHSLHNYRGKLVLVNFWATWCTPCRSEMPAIDAVYRSDRNHFVVLAVDKQEPTSDVASFARSLHLAYAPLIDTDGSVYRAYCIAVQPVSFWLDRTGVIRAIHYGPMDPAYMREELKRLST